MKTIDKLDHKISCVANSIEQFWSPDHYSDVEQFVLFVDDFESLCTRVVRPALRDYATFLAGGGFEFSLEFIRMENPTVIPQNYCKQLVRYRRCLFSGELANEDTWSVIEFVAKHPTCTLDVNLCVPGAIGRYSCTVSLRKNLKLQDVTVDEVISIFEDAISTG